MKKTYFLSDAHLGSLAFQDRRERERKLCAVLDRMAEDAEAIFMLGDMFDFWHEWGRVVPKGFTRFLGRLSELTDRGIEVHYLTGNHDIWAYDYLREECGVILHHQPIEVSLKCADGGSLQAFLAHGDGLGDPNVSFRFISSIFHSKVCQWMFAHLLLPDWAMAFGLEWARRSRLKHEPLATVDELGRPIPNDNDYKGEDREHLVIYTKQMMQEHPQIHYYIYGHRHIELQLMLSRDVTMFILGDSYEQFTYACWDGISMTLDQPGT